MSRACVNDEITRVMERTLNFLLSGRQLGYLRERRRFPGTSFIRRDQSGHAMLRQRLPWTLNEIRAFSEAWALPAKWVDPNIATNRPKYKSRFLFIGRET